MKKVGTVSSALGLIFLGAWMVVGNIDRALANKIFKLWPIIIIIIGLEVLYYYSRRVENQKVGFNPLIIFVVIIFIITNGYVELKSKYQIWGIDRGFDIVDFINKAEFGDFNFNRYKEIETSKTIDFNGKNLKVVGNNSTIEVGKSDDETVRIEGSVFVDKNWENEKYEIQPKIENDTCIVDFDNSYMKKVKMVKMKIYIPEGCNFNFEGNNIKVSASELTKSEFNIDANNGSVDIDSVLGLKININNGTIKTGDIPKVKIDGNNLTTKIGGNTEIVDVKINNGMLNLDNKICKDINIELDRGTVKVNTDDKNIGVNVNLDKGMAQINEEKRTNSGIAKTLGSGEGRVNIKVDSGTVIVKN